MCCKLTTKPHFDFLPNSNRRFYNFSPVITASCRNWCFVGPFPPFGGQQSRAIGSRPVAGIDEWDCSRRVKGFSMLCWGWVRLPVGNMWGLGHVVHECYMHLNSLCTAAVLAHSAPLAVVLHADRWCISPNCSIVVKFCKKALRVGFPVATPPSLLCVASLQAPPTFHTRQNKLQLYSTACYYCP